MSELRTEIIESSKARTDFLKWKLIGVSALGAAGLGLTKVDGGVGAYLVLTLIPLVCFYVDLICRHISLRILVIARFLRLADAGEEAAYEFFVQENRRSRGGSAFQFEEAALMYSTWVLSGIVLVLGAAFTPPGVAAEPSVTMLGCPVAIAPLVRTVFIASGLLGIVLTTANDWVYHRRIGMLDQVAKDPDVIEKVRAIRARGDAADRLFELV